MLDAFYFNVTSRFTIKIIEQYVANDYFNLVNNQNRVQKLKNFN